MTRTALVTSAAGFIGSHLSERLLSDGWRVTGIDCFTDTYSRSVKERNLATAKRLPCFALVDVDLVSADLCVLVARTGVVFHLAGQARLRKNNQRYSGCSADGECDICPTMLRLGSEQHNRVDTWAQVTVTHNMETRPHLQHPSLSG